MLGDGGSANWYVGVTSRPSTMRVDGNKLASVIKLVKEWRPYGEVLVGIPPRPIFWAFFATA